MATGTSNPDAVRDEVHTATGAGGVDVATAAAGIVERVIEDVFSTVGEIRAGLLALDVDARRRGGVLTRADVATLRTPIGELFAVTDCAPVGLGVIIAPDLLADAPLYLEWWQGAARLEVDLHPTSMSFYDYAAAPWFAVPRKTLRRHIVGPYVDVHGTERYVLTLTVPVLGDGGFLGVAGADMPAARLENLVLRELCALESRCGVVEVIVTGDDGRIVMSTSPRWLVGSMPPPEAIPAGAASVELSDLPWRLTVISG